MKGGKVMSRYNKELLKPKIINDYHDGLKLKEIASKHNVSETTVWKILKENEIIPSTKGVDIEYTNYDWTLYLDNFIEL